MGWLIRWASFLLSSFEGPWDSWGVLGTRVLRILGFRVVD